MFNVECLKRRYESVRFWNPRLGTMHSRKQGLPLPSSVRKTATAGQIVRRFMIRRKKILPEGCDHAH